MTSKDFMWEMQKNARIISNRAEYLQGIFDKGTQITSKISGDISGGGISDKVGNVAVELADLSQALKPYIERFEEQNKILEKLPAIEYDILFKRYVNNIDLYEYADRHQRSPRWSFKLHSKALKDLEVLL